jgi:putative transcriptional regulator
MLIRRLFVYALLMTVVGLWRAPSLASKPVTQSPIYFPGQLLVASPKIRDRRFKKTVVYLVKHNATSAYGIIINKIIGKQEMVKLMENLGLSQQKAAGSMNVHYGGPVRPTGAFMLHSSDYKGAKSRAVDSAISFTTDISILHAIAEKKGPKNFLLALGYAGWGSGQLGDEVARGDWSLTQATTDIVFGDKHGDIWERLVDASQVPL